MNVCFLIYLHFFFYLMANEVIVRDLYIIIGLFIIPIIYFGVFFVYVLIFMDDGVSKIFVKWDGIKKKK